MTFKSILKQIIIILLFLLIKSELYSGYFEEGEYEIIISDDANGILAIADAVRIISVPWCIFHKASPLFIWIRYPAACFCCRIIQALNEWTTSNRPYQPSNNFLCVMI